MNCCLADKEIGYNTEPILAGEKLANLWLKYKYSSIDLWNCDFFCREFWDSFHKATWSHIEEVSKIKWYFGCETSIFNGPSFREQSELWLKEMAKEKS